jgi:DNA-binding XRE family transcriptional regulator
MPSIARVSRTAINDGDRQLRRTSVRFGEEMRALRLRSGVSQARVAGAIGVARSVICRMERGDEDVSIRIRARAVKSSVASSGSPCTRPERR